MKFIIFILLFSSFLSFANDQAPPLNISQLTENVYLYTSYKKVEPWGMVGANGLVVIDSNEAHIVDTPWTIEGTKELIQWIQSKNLTIKSGIITHFHQDASGGIKFLNDLKIKTYATALTNKLLNSKHREQASNIITDLRNFFYFNA